MYASVFYLFIYLVLAYNLVRKSFSELNLSSPKLRAPKSIGHLARALVALYYLEQSPFFSLTIFSDYKVAYDRECIEKCYNLGKNKYYYAVTYSNQ